MCLGVNEKHSVSERASCFGDQKNHYIVSERIFFFFFFFLVTKIIILVIDI